jgi:hypothetical protein
MNTIHLTVNIRPETALNTSLWTLRDKKEPEPERIAVRFKNKEYMVVLDNEQPFFEVWGLDENEELKECEQIIRPRIFQTH